MGTPDFAVMPLRRLIEQGYQVVGVVTTPDKPAGRGLQVHQCAVKRYAVEVGLPVLQPEKLRSEEFVEAFRTLKADLGIVIAFRMLPEVIWAMPRLGTFNLHASLLPNYRGAAPINWAIINGERETGVTTFLLNHEIDKGDVLARERVAILPQDDLGTLHDKLMVLGTDLVVDTVEKIAGGVFTPMPQIDMEPGMTPREAPKIFKQTAHIDWAQTTEAIHNLVRGLNPYPGAWSELVPLAEAEMSASSSHPTLKIYKTRTERALHTHEVGRLFTDGKTSLKVATADGYLHVEELQVSGKKRMTTAELLRGFQQIKQYKMR